MYPISPVSYENKIEFPVYHLYWKKFFAVISDTYKYMVCFFAVSVGR